jgi:hypothetical protein
MPLLPRLIGEIEIRERRARYENEPRYKRLDFIREKRTTDSDQWDLVRTTRRPVKQQLQRPWEHPQWRHFDPYQQHQILWQYGLLEHPPMRPQQHEHAQLEQPQQMAGLPPTQMQQQIESAPEVLMLNPDEGDDNDGKASVRKVVVKPRKHYTGYSVFDSESEDDSQWGGRRRRRPSSVSSLGSGSSVTSSSSSTITSSTSSTSSHRLKPLRGW